MIFILKPVNQLKQKQASTLLSCNIYSFIGAGIADKFPGMYIVFEK